VTTFSPKREFWRDSVSDNGAEDGVGAWISVPDQQVVINDQEVTKTKDRSKEVLLPYLDFKVMLDRFIGTMYFFG
jgi:hypothetical protein